MRTFSYKNGFGLVEVVIVAAVLGTVLVYVFGAIQNSVNIANLSLERVQAAFLLEEGTEAVRSIRDQAWAGISNPTIGTPYYLAWNTNAWTLTTTPSTVGKFTRTIVFSAVNRDANFDIAGAGTNDTNTRMVTVTVTWLSASGSKTETFEFYIMNTFST